MGNVGSSVFWNLFDAGYSKWGYLSLCCCTDQACVTNWGLGVIKAQCFSSMTQTEISHKSPSFMELGL